jgi:hypothetical protein
MDSDDEELPIFEEEVTRKKKNQIMKMKVPVNLFNLWSSLKQERDLIG